MFDFVVCLICQPIDLQVDDVLIGGVLIQVHFPSILFACRGLLR